MNGTQDQVSQVDEIDALSRAQDLPRDLALIKMENESIMALAAAHPRNHAAVLKDIKDQLATYKSFAETAMYAKPVGKDDNDNMKYARGLSIRAAEAIASAYGFNRCHVEVSPLGDDAARVEATFVDYQTGRVFQKGSIVSKTYKNRYGKMKRHNDDRFYDIVCEAAGSKRLRECILRCVPPGLRSELELCVNEQLDSFLDDNTVKKIVAQFSEKGITDEQIEGLLGKRLDSLTKEDRQTLLGIWNSIKDGEATIADVFGDGDHAPFDASKVSKPAPDPPPPPPNETTTQGEPPPATVDTCPECGGKKHGRGYQHADRCSKKVGAVAPPAGQAPAEQVGDDVKDLGMTRQCLIREFDQLDKPSADQFLHQWGLNESGKTWRNIGACFDASQDYTKLEKKLAQVRARLAQVAK